MYSNISTLRRGLAVLASGVVLLAIGACALQTGTGSQTRSSATATLHGPPDPLAGYSFYVDPSSPALTQAAEWRAHGRTADADQLAKISSRPVARWLTASSARTDTVDALVDNAAALHQVPVLVAYNLPGRDCGKYSAGGLGSSDAYRAWIRALAASIGNRPAVVILEPDAIPQALQGCAGIVTDQRYALLSDAVALLKGSGSVRVYLDAGHPNWITDLLALATALRRSGVGQADGFALNVANFVTTADNVAYGLRLSDVLGGAHFVVDTSRNGDGPWPGDDQINGAPSWCNPPGRALGQAPTSSTGTARLDALLWIKPPGESDGPCRPGEPMAGEWWPEYALGLAERSA
jgi:endoglucanase